MARFGETGLRFIFSSFLTILGCWGGNISSLPRFSHDQKIPRIHTQIHWSIILFFWELSNRHGGSRGNLSLSLSALPLTLFFYFFYFFRIGKHRMKKIKLSGDLKGDFETMNKGKGIMETLTLLGEIETTGKLSPNFFSVMWQLWTLWLRSLMLMFFDIVLVMELEILILVVSECYCAHLD